MVVMKSLALPPLLMGCLRILPAGGVLVAWAALQVSKILNIQKYM